MFYICLLSIPFLHAFGFFNISFPLMIFSISIFFLVLSRNLNLRINFDKKDNLLIFFLLLGIISIDFSRVGFENLGHVYLWILSIGVFYFGTKILIINNSISISKIKKVFFIGLMITSIGVIFEFFTANFFGFYLSDYLPYAIGELDETRNFSGNLYRVRGFSAEPGFTAMVYELFLPLGLLYCYKKPHLYLFVFFILFGYLILTSAASLIILALLIIIFLARSNFKNFVRSVLAISLFGLIFYNQIAFYIFESIGPKLLLVFIGESVRIELLTNLTSIFFNNPFGIGLGTQSFYFENYGSFQGTILPGAGALNLYLEIAISSGYLGIISFLFFIIIVLFKSFKYSSSPERNALIFSFLWLLGHHFFLTEYYFPMIWVTIALLDKYQLLLKHK